MLSVGRGAGLVLGGVHGKGVNQIIRILKQEAALVFSALTLAIFWTVGSDWVYEASGGIALFTLFAWLFVAMLWGAFRVVHHAECLAMKLGEPYGTLILTFAVIGIEVALISAGMLTGKSSPLLARDTMMAVIMIVLNGLIGFSLLFGGLKHHEQSYQLEGARAFITVLLPLSVIALVLPRFTTSTTEPTLSDPQEVMFALLTIVLYGIFVILQTSRHRSHFDDPREDIESQESVYANHESEYGVPVHALLLVLTLLPIILLSKNLSVLVDAGVRQMGMPLAIGGIFIAAFVLAPEGMAAIRAATNNQLQRSVNLCLGSALATIGLTVPAVLAISLFIGEPVILGLDDTGVLLLFLTLLTTMLTFGGTRTNVLQGAVHLSLFATYLILIFMP